MTAKLNNILVAGLIGLILAIAGTIMITGPSVSAQEVSDKLCSGSSFKLDSGGSACDPAQGGQRAQNRVNRLIELGINIFSVIVGIVAVIMLIIAGLKYITSGGDSGKLTSAKQTIIYALIGLLIVALAQFAVRFVLSKTTTGGGGGGGGSSQTGGSDDTTNTEESAPETEEVEPEATFTPMTEESSSGAPEVIETEEQPTTSGN